ncbi:MAG: hypothetical protein ACLSVX_02030 [Massilimicrobiota timonensis]
MNLVRNYLNDESALEVSAQTILFIVIAVVIVVIIAFIGYNIINSGKAQTEQGMADFDNLVGDYNSLH